MSGHHSNNQPSSNATARHGVWLEAIALMAFLREGNQPAARELLETTTDPQNMIGDILSLFSLFLRAQDHENPEDVENFIEASLSVGPPPTFGSRPYLN